MIKKLFVAVMCSIILLGAGSKTVEASEKDTVPVEVQIDYSSRQDNPNGTTSYNVINAEDVASQYGVSNPKEVKLTYFNREDKNVPSPRSTYLSNLIYEGEACGTQQIARASSYNSSNKTVTKTISLSGTVSNSYSTNIGGSVGISSSSISAGVGFDVTASWTQSDSTQVTLAPKESVTVYGYELFDCYSFDIINDPLFGGAEVVGYGNAFRCVGMCTIVE